MYRIGVARGLLAWWTRRAIPESPVWERVNEMRRLATERTRSGGVLGAEATSLTRFTLFDLFVNPEIRRRTIIAFLMATTSAVAFWGISTWVPPYVGSVAAKAGLPAAQWASYTGMTYNFGSIIGYFGLGFLADAYGRKPITLLFFAMSLVLRPTPFLWTQDLPTLLGGAAVLGCFAPGKCTWM